MDIKALAQGKVILWGAACSYYSAKIRPYLRKKGIEYVEIHPSHPHYHNTLLPQIGYTTVPVIEFPSGEFIADSLEAIEFFEQQHPENPMIPNSKPLAAIAWLIHNYGSEGLHKPAMHYRWNTTEENREYITDEFSRWFETKPQRESKPVTKGMEFAESMKAYLPLMGINDTTVGAIESSAQKLYDTLNAHFLEYPYILGGRPSIADFGMMAPLYAHLGRDMFSSNEVKHRSPALYRWIETMLNPTILDPELWHVPPTYFNEDQLPNTLLALLTLICDDYGPEIIATAATYHQWLKAEPSRPAGTFVSINEEKGAHQLIGEIEHVQQGTSIKRIALLDPLIQHQRLTAVTDSMNDTERKTFIDVMNKAGGTDIADLKLERALVRENYLYVVA